MANIRPLSIALSKKAAEELNEIPARLQDDIDNLKIWTKKQNNFISRSSDQFLVAFLRGCKHSLERSKEKLENYYKLKANMIELYNNRNSDDPKILEILKQGIVLPLLKPNGDDGPIVHIIRAGSYDPNKIKFNDIIKVGTIIADIYMLENDNAVIGGLVEVLDFENVSAQHLFHLDASFVKKFAIQYENGMPIRQKEFHFMNIPPGFEALYNIFKLLISSKNRDRVHIHAANDMKIFHEHFPKDILPEEYGGNCGTIKEINDYWIEKFLKYKDYFLDENNYMMMKSIKEDKIDNNLEIRFSTNFGTDGSFRKIDFD